MGSNDSRSSLRVLLKLLLSLIFAFIFSMSSLMEQSVLLGSLAKTIGDSFDLVHAGVVLRLDFSIPAFFFLLDSYLFSLQDGRCRHNICYSMSSLTHISIVIKEGKKNKKVILKILCPFVIRL